MSESVYPIVIKFNSKEVQVGSVKVEIDSGTTINNYQEEHKVTLKEINIQYKKGDFLTKVLSRW